MLLDTHCHIDLYPDYAQLIEEVEAQSIHTIAVTTTPSVFKHLQSLVSSRRFIHPAIGLHPELALQRQRELSLWLELLPETHYVGEVGLDFVTQDVENRRIQRRVFEQVVKSCAESGDKILTIHSRRAATEVVDIIGPNFPGQAILHWYSGSLKVLERGLKNGLFFSVNPAMLASDNGLKIVRAIPPDRLLTETDGPFVQLGGKSARPQSVAMVVRHLALLWERDENDVVTQIESNFRATLQNTDVY